MVSVRPKHLFEYRAERYFLDSKVFGRLDVFTEYGLVGVEAGKKVVEQIGLGSDVVLVVRVGREEAQTTIQADRDQDTGIASRAVVPTANKKTPTVFARPRPCKGSLGNSVARARFRTLAHQLKVWALEKKRPWLYLLFGSARRFIPPFIAGAPKHKRPAPWLNPSVVKRHRAALTGYLKAKIVNN